MVTPSLSRATLAALLDAHARFAPVELAPSLSAWCADEEVPLWAALEEAAGERLGAPFFAVPWPGAQLLAHAVERGLVDVHGRRVLDVGCGSGLASVACARRGAEVVACDVDVLACMAAKLLAERHEVRLDALCCDALERFEIGCSFDVVLAGDLVYSRAQGERLSRAVAAWRSAGATVVLADSGRPFFSSCGLPEVLAAEVRVPRSVEGAERRRVRLYVGP